MGQPDTRRIAVVLGLGWSVFVAVTILHVPPDADGVKHLAWWRDDLAMLVVLAGVLIPLYGGDILGRVRLARQSGKPVGKTTSD